MDETLLFKNIHTLCDEKKLSVAQMLNDLGLPESTVSNLREQRRWMVYLPNIAHYLDVSIDSLFSPLGGEQTKLEELTATIKRLKLADADLDVLCGVAKLLSEHYK